MIAQQGHYNKIHRSWDDMRGDLLRGRTPASLSGEFRSRGKMVRVVTSVKLNGIKINNLLLNTRKHQEGCE